MTIHDFTVATADGAKQSLGDYAGPTTYNVTFPIFSKIEVNGPAADPLFAYLRAQPPVTSDRPRVCCTTTSRRRA